MTGGGGGNRNLCRFFQKRRRRATFVMKCGKATSYGFTCCPFPSPGVLLSPGEMLASGGTGVPTPASSSRGDRPLAPQTTHPRLLRWATAVAHRASLEVPRAPRPVARHLACERPHSLHAAVRALAPAAGERIVDEPPLPARLEMRHQQVMHDPVTEVGGEDLAPLGLLDQEGLGPARPVGVLLAGSSHQASARMSVLLAGRLCPGGRWVALSRRRRGSG